MASWLRGGALLALALLAGCATVQEGPEGEWRNGRQWPQAARASCERDVAQLRDPVDAQQRLAHEMEAYLPLVEQALAYRAETIELARHLRTTEILSGADLQRLNEGMRAHLDLRERLFAVAESHECWLTLTDAQLHMTPAQRLQGLMISLSAALVLYDNYLLAVSVYDDEARLRRVLNTEDSGFGLGRDILNTISLSYNSVDNRARVRAAIYFYEQEHAKLMTEALRDPALAYLGKLIEQSPSYDMTRALSPAAVVGRKLRFMERVTTDQLTQLGKEGVNLFSMLFGNTVGLVETRKGKLHRRDDVRAELARSLRAGDILLEKTPFRLTDALIPGHWGHAAIWLGSDQELKALGLEHDPLVVRYRERMGSGARVVEALRAGVQINSLDHFLNIDDLAVLRARAMSDAERAEVIRQALRQVGKGYDFNFDVETKDRIVCSELVYVAYTGIGWPTAQTLGRATISPDQIAFKALAGGPLELVLLYSDGERVSDRPDTRLAGLVAETR